MHPTQAMTAWVDKNNQWEIYLCSVVHMYYPQPVILCTVQLWD